MAKFVASKDNLITFSVFRADSVSLAYEMHKAFIFLQWEINSSGFLSEGSEVL